MSGFLRYNSVFSLLFAATGSILHALGTLHPKNPHTWQISHYTQEILHTLHIIMIIIALHNNDNDLLQQYNKWTITIFSLPLIPKKREAIIILFVALEKEEESGIYFSFVKCFCCFILYLSLSFSTSMYIYECYKNWLGKCIKLHLVIKDTNKTKCYSYTLTSSCVFWASTKKQSEKLKRKGGKCGNDIFSSISVSQNHFPGPKKLPPFLS